MGFDKLPLSPGENDLEGSRKAVVAGSGVPEHFLKLLVPWELNPSQE